MRPFLFLYFKKRDVRKVCFTCNIMESFMCLYKYKRSALLKLSYGSIVIGIMRLVSLFKLAHLRKAAEFLGPILLSKNERTTKAIEKTCSYVYRNSL